MSHRHCLQKFTASGTVIVAFVISLVGCAAHPPQAALTKTLPKEHPSEKSDTCDKYKCIHLQYTNKEMKKIIIDDNITEYGKKIMFRDCDKLCKKHNLTKHSIQEKYLPKKERRFSCVCE